MCVCVSGRVRERERRKKNKNKKKKRSQLVKVQDSMEVFAQAWGKRYSHVNYKTSLRRRSRTRRRKPRVALPLAMIPSGHKSKRGNYTRDPRHVPYTRPKITLFFLTSSRHSRLFLHIFLLLDHRRRGGLGQRKYRPLPPPHLSYDHS